MTQPYGQQPGNYGQQPGGYPQQPGGYPQQSGGFPQAPSYPQAPGYAPGAGGLPTAPPDQGYGGPMQRPGTVTAAAVLGFVQAGITTITTLLIFVGLFNAGGSASGTGWLLGISQLAGIILLIWGGVQLLGGRGRVPFIIGAALEILISLYYIISVASADVGGISVLESAKSAIVAIAVAFAVMPAIGLIMALGGSTAQFVQSRR